mgnify:CR=1 FL=1
MVRKVAMSKLVEKMNLKNLTPDVGLAEKYVEVPDINRPALQLTGFYDHFDNERVQLMGNVEMAYLSGLSREHRMEMYDKLWMEIRA